MLVVTVEIAVKEFITAVNTPEDVAYKLNPDPTKGKSNGSTPAPAPPTAAASVVGEGG